MKWLVISLLLANGLLLFATERWGSADPRAQLSEGRLPRVASIELIPGVQPDEGDRPLIQVIPPPGEEAISRESPAEPTGNDERAAPGCIRMGWFASQDSARSIVRQLGFEEADAPTVEVAQRQPPLYWVLLPRAPDQASALELYRELNEQGMEAYVLTEGERRNAISLGLFQSTGAARGVLEEARQQGFEPRIDLFEREEVVYAVDFSGQNAARIRQMSARIVALDEAVELVEMKACQGVATPLKSP